MEEGQWREAPIEHVTIEQNTHPIREFLHRHLPTTVVAPPERPHSDILPGDSIRFRDGRVRKIGAVARSAEGTRYAFSSNPNPSKRK